MPDCPNCGTWNPDDKDVCWRCQTELPRPVEKKKRDPRRIGGFPMWFWLALVFFFTVTILGQCLMPPVVPGG
jgi:predicted amidophosphoribosyltransferase